jgi:hypothetical protein
MQHGSLFTRRGAIAGSAASLLAATGRPFGEARAQPTAATGGGPNPDLLTLERSDRRFSALTQGFNRRWAAPNCAKIFIPLTEAGAQQALATAAAFGPGRFRVRSGGHCYEDFVFSDESEALIDMSLLNRIGQDPQTGVFSRASRRQQLAALYAALLAPWPDPAGGFLLFGRPRRPSVRRRLWLVVAPVRADRRLAHRRSGRDTGRERQCCF